MTYPPRSRVLVTSQDSRKAIVVSKVDGVDAYCIRLGDGRRITVAGSELQPNVKGSSRG